MRRVPLEAHFSRQRRLWNLCVPSKENAGVSFSFTPEQFRSFVRQLHHLRVGSDERCAVRRVVLSDGEQALPLDIDTSTLERIATYLKSCEDSYEAWMGQVV
jgi:hypothetical protein